MPVGPRGLEYSDRAKALADQTVTIDGFLISQSMPVSGQLLLGPAPMQLHEHEYGFAEDLPANIVHVILVDAQDQTLEAARSRVRVQGRLRLGARNETDGRVSHVRLECARDDVKFVDVAAAGLRPAPANTSACGHAH